MRFSDMMGSGNDRSTPPEADTVVANALAPYLDAATPAAPVDSDPAPENAPDDDAPAVEVETPPTESAASVFPVTPVTAVTPVAAPVDDALVGEAASPARPLTTSFADFTPLSDDLLPRRR